MVKKIYLQYIQHDFYFLNTLIIGYCSPIVIFWNYRCNTYIVWIIHWCTKWDMTLITICDLAWSKNLWGMWFFWDDHSLSVRPKIKSYSLSIRCYMSVHIWVKVVFEFPPSLSSKTFYPKILLQGFPCYYKEWYRI